MPDEDKTFSGSLVLMTSRAHYWISLTPVKTRYLLTSITWPYRGLESTTYRDQVFFVVDRWPSAGFESWAHVRLTFCKQGRIVRKPVNPRPGLKSIPVITFSSIQTFFLAALFCVCGDWKTQNRKPNNKQKTSLQSYKTQIKILHFPGLA